MLYLRAESEIKAFSKSQQNWTTIFEKQLLTERELGRLQRMGYNLKYSEFTPVVSSQRNVSIVDNRRYAIDETKIVIYWKGVIEDEHKV